MVDFSRRAIDDGCIDGNRVVICGYVWEIYVED